MHMHNSGMIGWACVEIFNMMYGQHTWVGLSKQVGIFRYISRQFSRAIRYSDFWKYSARAAARYHVRSPRGCVK